MNAKLTFTSIVASLCALVAQARAQNAVVAETPEEKPAVPVKALEVMGSTGYTQGFGELQSGVNLQDVITRGLAVDVMIGYRLDPHWVVGAIGQYTEYDAQRTATARGAVAGIGATYHVLPFDRWDPFINFGTGYRLLWESAATGSTEPTLLTHGFEPARLMVGLDYRASRDLAFMPMVGVDLSIPLWQSLGGNNTTISDPRPSTYIFAGLGLRFDVTNRYERRGGAVPVTETRTTQAPIAP